MVDRRLDDNHRLLLEATAAALEGARFALPAPDLAKRNQRREELADGIRHTLLPRLSDPDAPVVGVVIGLTGTGRSTLVNSLAGRRISSSGPTRPTTAKQVVWAHQRHAGRYWSDFVSLVKEQLDPNVELVVSRDQIVNNLTLIDGPPLDLSTPRGSSAAAALLGVADLCIFVASATRYADSDAWDQLRLIGQRGLPILHVLNRLPAGLVGRQVAADYADRLWEEGMLNRPDPTLLFTALEQHVDRSIDGLPGPALAGLREELSGLSDPQFRDRLYDATTGTLFERLAAACRTVADYSAGEAAAAERLAAAVESAYADQLTDLTSRIDRGEFESLAGAWRPQEFEDALTRRAGNAAQSAATAWSADAIGKHIVEGDDKLWRHGNDAGEASETAVAAWMRMLRQIAGTGIQGGWLRRRRSRKLAAALRSQVMRGRAARLDPALSKAYGPGSAVLLRAAGEALAAAAGDALARDRTRFDELVGDPLGAVGLGDFLRDRAGEFEIAAKEYLE